MRIKIQVKLTPKQIYKLDKIGWEGSASNGYYQDFDYCLNKAIEEFIKKYDENIEK